MEKFAYDYENTGREFDFNALSAYGNKLGQVMFYDFVNQKISKEVNLSKLSKDKYQYNNSVVLDIIGNIALSKINEGTIELIDNKLREKYADSTVNRFHIFVQKYIKKAIKDRVIRDNPYQFVELKKSEDTIQFS